jgi:hypothetical protein
MIMSGSSRGSLVVSLNFFLVDFFMFMDENKGFFFSNFVVSKVW